MKIERVVAFPNPSWFIIKKRGGGGVRGNSGSCQTIDLKVGRLICHVGKGINYCCTSEEVYYDNISGRDYCGTREELGEAVMKMMMSKV